LRFNLVNFFDRHGPLTMIGVQATLKERRTAAEFRTGNRLVATKFSQHIKFSPTHKIILALALDNPFEICLAIAPLAARLWRVEIRPIFGRISDKLRHL
jgi:hypothetical protein